MYLFQDKNNSFSITLILRYTTLKVFDKIELIFWELKHYVHAIYCNKTETFDKKTHPVMKIKKSSTVNPGEI